MKISIGSEHFKPTLILFIFLQVIDSITTIIGRRVGACEVNIIMDNLLGMSNGFIYFFTFKVVFSFVFGYFIYSGFHNADTENNASFYLGCLFAITIFYAYIAVNNIGGLLI